MNIIDKKIKKRCEIMILLGCTIATLSLIGLIVFAITGLYLIHPIFYIELWILGNGLSVTGSVNALENFNKEEGN